MNHDERRARREKIRAALDAGQDPAKVAEQFGVSASYTRSLAPKSKRPLRTLAIIARLLRGEDPREISGLFSLTPQAVYLVRKNGTDAGIEFP